MSLPQPWKPTLLLDVDGVILNFTELYVRCAVMAKVVHPMFHSNGFVPDVWDIGDSLKLTVDGRAAVHKHLDAPGAGRTILPYEDAIPVVKSLMNWAHVYFVTTSLETNPTWESDRRWVFTKLFGYEACRRLVFIQHKEQMEGDIFIDDKQSNVEKWYHKHPNKTAILWPHEYNMQGISDGFSHTTFVGDGFIRPPKRDWDWLLAFVMDKFDARNQLATS